MECVNLLKKRRLETEVEPWRPKRVCLEAELQSAECPMETSHTFTVSNQQQEQQVQATPPPLCCPRCLGGEPGHINHIMGHWAADLWPRDRTGSDLLTPAGPSATSQFENCSDWTTVSYNRPIRLHSCRMMSLWPHSPKAPIRCFFCQILDYFIDLIDLGWF